MLLTIDLGNTNLTLGLFDGDQLGARWRLATDHERMPDEYGLQMLGLLQHSGCPPSQVHGVSFSSVVPSLSARLIQACQRYLNQDPFTVDTSVRTGIRNLYEDPKAVGADRIVDAAATMALYGGPACIVDFGTATTFNALTADGDYLGGAIFAGINVAAEALVQRTSKLMRVDLHRPPGVIGRNTTQAIQSGFIFGYVALVEGMVARFKAELGEKTKVVATGGQAELIAPATGVIDILDPWLTLHGLRIIWDMNR